MTDLEPTTTNDTPFEAPHANVSATNDEPPGTLGVGRDPTSLDGDPTVMNMRLMQEIKILHQKLSELERVARPKLDHETLEAEWERAREELGSEEERRKWNEEKRRRHEGLMATNTLEPRRAYGHMPGHISDEELVYNAKLFQIRKTWEQKLVSGLDFGQRIDSDFNSDSDSDDSFYTRRALLERACQIEIDQLRHEREAHIRTQKILIRKKLRQRHEPLPKYDERKREDDGNKKVDGISRETTDKATEDAVNLDARSELIRVPWTQFKSLLGQKEVLSAAIDILKGEPVIELDHSQYFRWNTTYTRRGKATQTQEKRSELKLDIAPGEGPMPERIRINSKHILQILSSIHKSKDLIHPSLILLRPFRILAYYSRAIREHCKKLEKRLRKDSPNEDTSAGYSESTLDIADGSKYTEETSQQGPDNLEPLSKGEVEGGKEVQEEGEGGKDEYEGDDVKAAIALEHMNCLIEFIDKDMQSRINYLESRTCQKVAFSDLWYLFQPGGLVIGNNGKQAYQILSMHSVGHKVIDPWSRWHTESPAKEEEAPIAIKCVYIDFDGKQLGPVSKIFHIPRFEREKVVTSLEIYPLRFHPFHKDSTTAAAGDGIAGNVHGFKKYLTDRGRMFLKVAAIRLAAIQPMYYAGPALQTQDEIESQVVVDFEAALGIEEHIEKHWKPELETLIGSDNSDEDKTKNVCSASCCIDEAVHNDSYVEKKRNEEFMGQLLPKTREGMPSVVVLPRPLDIISLEAELTEDDLAIMSYRVFGFVLRNRKWAQLDLTHLSEAQPSGIREEGDEKPGECPKKHTTAFDRLVLPDQHKDMILSLVTQHFRGKESSHNGQAADIVRGKGKGLILLLHGAPGVGKTTTAEGVAEIFKKPLFQLTCGDLGTTAKEVESALETNFALANRWGCVLLLDEADVFLAQRTKEDFKRNGLVAVFLRVLEYYAGILFLTTNRVGDFDEAFASRIHVSLYYPELGREETLKVFELNLQLIQDRFKGKSSKFVPDKMRIGAFAQEYWDKNPFDHWNGRQIRNACQTALALAEYEAQGKNHMLALNPNVEVQLNRSHFETVAEAYLAFSKHLKDIYGTHAARRAKEAGLRAMWVNEKGDIMGTIGPKEAKAMRKSRFMAKSHGRYNTETYEQQQHFVSSGHNPQYGGGQEASQGSWGQQYNNPPPQGPYSDTPMPRQFNSPQQQRGMMVSQPAPRQNWDSSGPGYGYDQQQPKTGGRGNYPQQYPQQRSAHHLQPPRGHSPQPPRIGQPPLGGEYSEFEPEN